MKSALRYILPVTLLMVIFSSCSNKGPKEAALIPKTASAVIVLDPGAMQDKLTSGGISVDTLFSRIFKNDSSDAEDRKKLDDFRNNAGIDWKKQLFGPWDQVLSCELYPRQHSEIAILDLPRLRRCPKQSSHALVSCRTVRYHEGHQISLNILPCCSTIQTQNVIMGSTQ